MRYFLIVLLLGLCTSIYGQEPATKVITTLENFPESWSGNWSGTLEIFNAKGLVQSVNMTVEIHKIDTSKENRYTFGLIYGSKEKDWRPYEIVPVKPEVGLWKLDEKNSIVMESYLTGPKLLCLFTVEGVRIMCSYEKTGEDTMVFEVISGAEAAVSTTGNTKQGEEDIPEVKSFPCTGFQRALLKRQ